MNTTHVQRWITPEEADIIVGALNYVAFKEGIADEEIEMHFGIPRVELVSHYETIRDEMRSSRVNVNNKSK